MLKETVVKEWLKQLSRSQGFYSRLYSDLNANNKALNEFTELLNKNNVKTMLDMILFLEA